MNMVAKGRPEASISSCSAGCKPARAISTPGRTQAERARASVSTITSVTWAKASGSLGGGAIGRASPAMGAEARSAGKAI